MKSKTKKRLSAIEWRLAQLKREAAMLRRERRLLTGAAALAGIKSPIFKAIEK